MVHVRTEVVARIALARSDTWKLGETMRRAGPRKQISKLWQPHYKDQGNLNFCSKMYFSGMGWKEGRVGGCVNESVRCSKSTLYTVPTLSNSLFSQFFVVCVPFLWNFSRLGIISFYLHRAKLSEKKSLFFSMFTVNCAVRSRCKFRLFCSCSYRILPVLHL